MASDKVLHISDSEFETKIVGSATPCLVDFWAPWCGPCKAIAPILTELATEFSGKLRIAKVNIDDDGNDAIATKFGIRAIPTMLLFKNGKVAEQIVGMVPKAALQEKIKAQI